MASLKDVVAKNLSLKEPFWHKYSGQFYGDLNKVKIPSNQMIKKYQLQKIEEFQESALKKENQKTDLINPLFQNGDINILYLDSEKKQKIELDKALFEIVNNIRDFRKLKNDWTIEDRYNKAQESLKKLEFILTDLKKKIDIKSPIYEKDLDELSKLIKNNSLKSFNQKDMRDWISRLNQFQGEVVEEIGTAWLEKRIPQDLKIKTVSTGKIYYSGGKYGSRGQLIQDMLTLDIENSDLINNIQIEYWIGNEQKTESIIDFLSTIQNYSGKEQIKIDDNLYEVLLSASALNIQAKSGLNQLPWNVSSKNTQVTIGEYDKDNLEISVRHTFELLHSLDKENPKDLWIKDQDEKYNALANYGLATILSKTLHLNQLGNQYLLTPSGFISYPSRILQLFKDENDIITLSGKVTIGDNTLQRRYAVNIPYYKKLKT